jgi:hypothetical protein
MSKSDPSSQRTYKPETVCLRLMVSGLVFHVRSTLFSSPFFFQYLDIVRKYSVHSKRAVYFLLPFD